MKNIGDEKERRSGKRWKERDRVIGKVERESRGRAYGEKVRKNG